MYCANNRPHKGARLEITEWGPASPTYPAEPLHISTCSLIHHLVLGSIHVTPEPEGSALVGHVLVEGVKIVHELDDLPHGAGDVVAVEAGNVAVEQPVCACAVNVAL